MMTILRQISIEFPDHTRFLMPDVQVSFDLYNRYLVVYAIEMKEYIIIPIEEIIRIAIWQDGKPINRPTVILQPL